MSFCKLFLAVSNGRTEHHDLPNNLILPLTLLNILNWNKQSQHEHLMTCESRVCRGARAAVLNHETWNNQSAPKEAENQ